MDCTEFFDWCFSGNVKTSEELVAKRCSDKDCKIARKAPESFFIWQG